MTVSMPPRLSDIDIDYIVDRRPIFVANPEWDEAPYMPDSLAEIKIDPTNADLEMMEEMGCTNASWNWYPDGDNPDEVRF